MSSRIALWLCSALGIMCPEVPLPSLDQMVQDAKKINDISLEIDRVIEKTTPEYNEFLERIDQMRVTPLSRDWNDFLSKQQVVIGNLFRQYFPTEDMSTGSILERIEGIYKNLTGYKERFAKKPEIGENRLSLEDIDRLLRKCLILDKIVNRGYDANWLRLRRGRAPECFFRIKYSI